MRAEESKGISQCEADRQLRLQDITISNHTLKNTYLDYYRLLPLSTAAILALSYVDLLSLLDMLGTQLWIAENGFAATTIVCDDAPDASCLAELQRHYTLYSEALQNMTSKQPGQPALPLIGGDVFYDNEYLDTVSEQVRQDLFGITGYAQTSTATIRSTTLQTWLHSKLAFTQDFCASYYLSHICNTGRLKTLRGHPLALTSADTRFLVPYPSGGSPLPASTLILRATAKALRAAGQKTQAVALNVLFRHGVFTSSQDARATHFLLDLVFTWLSAHNKIYNYRELHGENRPADYDPAVQVFVSYVNPLAILLI